MTTTKTTVTLACAPWCADPGSVNCEGGGHCAAETRSQFTTAGKPREIETRLSRETGEFRVPGLPAEARHAITVGIGPRGGQLKYATMTAAEATDLAERLLELAALVAVDPVGTEPTTASAGAAFCEFPDVCTVDGEPQHDRCERADRIVEGDDHRQVRVRVRRTGDGPRLAVVTDAADGYFDAETALSAAGARGLRDVLDEAVRLVEQDAAGQAGDH